MYFITVLYNSTCNMMKVAFVTHLNAPGSLIKGLLRHAHFQYFGFYYKKNTFYLFAYITLEYFVITCLTQKWEASALRPTDKH